MKAWIRGYGMHWMALHVAWALALGFWFYSLYEQSIQ
jgi:hypothetical protein